MREIKFRVWDTVTKQMFTGFHLFGEMTLTGGIHAWQHEEAEKIGIKRDTLGALNDLIEMQYTGLKDVHGKEIYEGDICRDDEAHYKIIWCDQTMRWDLERLEDGEQIGGFGSTVNDFFRSVEDCKVIGNIYENENLL